MAKYELDTKVYTDFAAVELDDECEYGVWLAASKLYWDAHDFAKAQWEAIPDGDAKNSAMFNADDMQLDCLFSADNKLAWYVAAVATYELNV